MIWKKWVLPLDFIKMSGQSTRIFLHYNAIESYGKGKDSKASEQLFDRGGLSIYIHITRAEYYNFKIEDYK